MPSKDCSFFPSNQQSHPPKPSLVEQSLDVQVIDAINLTPCSHGPKTDSHPSRFILGEAVAIEGCVIATRSDSADLMTRGPGRFGIN